MFLDKLGSEARMGGGVDALPGGIQLQPETTWTIIIENAPIARKSDRYLISIGFRPRCE